MVLRRLSLQEWFQAHQFRHLLRHHLFLPISVELDVTAIARRYQSRGERVPYTAILVKAMGLAARQVPAANSIYQRTFWGERVIEFERAHVNVPVLCEHQGIRYLNIATVLDADTTSVRDIAAQLQTVKTKSLDSPDMPLTRLVATGSNSFFNRLRLRLYHFAAMNLPQLWRRRAVGGLSVTSIYTASSKPHSVMPMAYGPTTFTAGLAHVDVTPERMVMKVGFGFDHTVAPGYLVRQFIDAVAAALKPADEPELAAFD